MKKLTKITTVLAAISVAIAACVLCACVEKEPDHTHTFDRDIASAQYLKTAASCIDKAVYYYSCECGEKGTSTFEHGEALGHEAVTAWSTDGDEHWHECVRNCGEKLDKAAHTGGTATCTEKATCETCEHEYGEVIAHTFDRQVATESYLQTGATCIDKAVYYYSCECGERGTETFEHGEALGHEAVTVWSTDGAEHWHECVRNCGQKLDKATHTGGTATCTDKATCETCEHEYGEALGHEAVTAWSEEGNYHWHACVRSCGEKLNYGTHTGGTATCTDKAVCETCSYDYGEALGHEAVTIWSTDGNEHWHECVRSCGQKLDSGTHSVGELKITTLPDKTLYIADDTFDAAGMVAKHECAVCKDLYETVDNALLTYDTSALAEGTKKLTVSYGDNSADVPLYVRGYTYKVEFESTEKLGWADVKANTNASGGKIRGMFNSMYHGDGGKIAVEMAREGNVTITLCWAASLAKKPFNEVMCLTYTQNGVETELSVSDEVVLECKGWNSFNEICLGTFVLPAGESMISLKQKSGVTAGYNLDYIVFSSRDMLPFELYECEDMILPGAATATTGQTNPCGGGYAGSINSYDNAGVQFTVNCEYTVQADFYTLIGGWEGNNEFLDSYNVQIKHGDGEWIDVTVGYTIERGAGFGVFVENKAFTVTLEAGENTIRILNRADHTAGSDYDRIRVVYAN